MERDWSDLSYLAAGTPRQRAAYAALHHLHIPSILAPYGPVLAGTIPLGLDLEGSDLDIICEAPDLGAFQRTVTSAFGAHQDFRAAIKDKAGLPSVIAGFMARGFPIELFAQQQSATQQRACLHLDIEARLLRLGGEPTLLAIRGLRRQGLKTEPAFAHHLQLQGDPYLALLDLARCDDAALLTLLRRAMSYSRPPNVDVL